MSAHYNLCLVHNAQQAQATLCRAIHLSPFIKAGSFATIQQHISKEEAETSCIPLATAWWCGLGCWAGNRLVAWLKEGQGACAMGKDVDLEGWLHAHSFRPPSGSLEKLRNHPTLAQRLDH